MSVASRPNSDGECTVPDRSTSGYRIADRRGRSGCEETAEVLRSSPAESAEAERILDLLGLARPVVPFHQVSLSPTRLTAALRQWVREHRAGDPVTSAPRPAELTCPNEPEPEHAALWETSTLCELGSFSALLPAVEARCREELLLVLPGGARPYQAFPTVLASAARLLDHGIRVRMIYQHAARGDLVTRASARELTQQGAEIRTSAELIGPLLACDRELVLLPTPRNPTSGSRGTGVAAVRDPALVAFVHSAFDNLWNNATPLVPDTRETSPAIDDLKKSIVRLMAKGHKDELVSRRLGISVRTCRRHIAEVMEELRATSRFQAGVELARAGILEGPAHPPARPDTGVDAEEATAG